MMNNSFLEQQLIQYLKQYQAENLRYRQMAVSCQEPQLLDEIITLLKPHLTDYTVWHGFEYCENAPMAGCSRFEFIQAIFNNNSNLMLCYPDNWLRYWSENDKQAFWRALSQKQSSHAVLLLFLENPEFFKLNQSYFISQTMAETATVWLSSRLPIA
jgi:hypothetical protein